MKQMKRGFHKEPADIRDEMNKMLKKDLLKKSEIKRKTEIVNKSQRLSNAMHNLKRGIK